MTSNSDPTSQASLDLGDDEKSFRRLFDRYYQPVVSFFANRGFSAEDCKDLAQETFVRVYHGRAGYRREASFTTWLFRIATNIWLSELRHRSAAKRESAELSLGEVSEIEEGPDIDGGEDGPGKESHPQASIAVSGGQGPLAEALAHEKSRILREALADLPPQMRRCVALRVYQDLKYREIAAVLGLSINTVKSQLHQARAKLATVFPEIEV